jgi:mRNA interferase RelE/StbE
MKWQVDFTPSARKQLENLDKSTKLRIKKDIEEKLIIDPNRFLIPLHGDLAESYKFRVGDYRLLCKKENKKFLILVIKIKHRKEVYKY